MEDDNEDDLKNKEDLHIAGRHTTLDIFRFAVFFNPFLTSEMKIFKIVNKGLVLSSNLLLFQCFGSKTLTVRTKAVQG